ncbi:MAG: cupin domain-containing protein [Bacteroidales bacterium]|nr:cupin domain-containing protein [Bacteroidales bacterium]
MPTIINPEELHFQSDPSALPQFDLKTLTPRLFKMVGSEHLYFDIRNLDPGKYSFPYHFHRNAEELMMVITGSMTLRTPEGLKELHPGELVFFEMGETGAHQFYNHTESPCTYLDIRTKMGLDVSEYPDSGKINIIPYSELYEKSTKVGYNKGEENVETIWKKLKDQTSEK